MPKLKNKIPEWLQEMYNSMWSFRMNARELDVKTLPFIEITDRKSFRALPSIACVYFVIVEGKIVYVGKAIELNLRWGGHKFLKRVLEWPNTRIAWLELAPRDLTVFEVVFIEQYAPEWNQIGKRAENDDCLRSDPEQFRGIWN